MESSGVGKMERRFSIKISFWLILALAYLTFITANFAHGELGAAGLLLRVDGMKWIVYLSMAAIVVATKRVGFFSAKKRHCFSEK